jgi:hypothetical protein
MPMSMVMMVVLVVGAAFRLCIQTALQKHSYQGPDRLPGLARHHGDGVLVEHRQRALANAANDDHTDIQSPKPARKRTGLVLGRGQRFGAHGGFGLWIHFHDGKLTAAAEMPVEASVLNWNSNFHNVVICL